MNNNTRPTSWFPKWISAMLVAVMVAYLAAQLITNDTSASALLFAALSIASYLAVAIGAPKRLLITKILAVVLAVVAGPIQFVFFTLLPIERYNPASGYSTTRNPYPVLLGTWIAFILPLVAAGILDRRRESP